MEDLLRQLSEAIAVNQCAEASATEKHIKLALGLVNGYLITVQLDLEAHIKREAPCA